MTSPDYFYEKKYPDINWIAGVDEAGRGAWAGDIFVAVFMLHRRYIEAQEVIPLDDSKKLSPKKRSELFSSLEEYGAYKVGRCSSEEIDQMGLTAATATALSRAISQLSQQPEVLLLDAGIFYKSNIPCVSIVKGDQKSYSIAGASIAAKVSRDRYMETMGESYPEWDFSIHMGYGTKLHSEKITQHGISPIHRKSFKPIHEILNQKQETLYGLF